VQAVARTVVVTGASSGIGRAIAARFAADGAQVFITGRTEKTIKAAAAELDDDTPGNVIGVVCDSTDPRRLSALVSRLGERVDVLVNASGGLVPAESEADGDGYADEDGAGVEVAGGDGGEDAEASASAVREGEAGVDLDADIADDVERSVRRGPDEDPLESLKQTWNAYVAQNVLGAVLTTAAVRDLLRPGSSVVSIGSIGAERRGGAYGAAKAALAAWSAGLSAELGPRGVTVNVVAPGYIEGTGFFLGSMNEARHELLVSETYDRRAGTPEDVAELVFFLASDGARHLTGQTIHLNGGAFTTR
jgi:3-oxoacyl-[acyl-carrier protein] reductase